MSRIGLSNYIDCKSTNSGDGDVVSCVGCEPGHKVVGGIRSQVTNHIGHYLSNQVDRKPTGNTGTILPWQESKCTHNCLAKS